MPDHTEVLEPAAVEKGKRSNRYWTPEEHTRFMEGMERCDGGHAAGARAVAPLTRARRFGSTDSRAVSQFVGTRSNSQVRTHAQKYFLRIVSGSAGGAARGQSLIRARRSNGGRRRRTRTS